MTTTLGRRVFGRLPALAFALAALQAGSLAAAAPAAAEQRGPQSVAPIAEKLIDAVVNISTSQIAKGPEGVPLPKVPKGSPFEDFFEDFFNKKGGRTPPSERKVSSLGSGFVIDGTEGLVVTNNHVIEGADEIIVNFHDGSKLKVDKVLGRDTKTDLALLKVTPKKPLVSVPFGSSANLRVGDWVMAIGNPFGLGGSLTVGIISAKQRDINAGPYDDFLQTDAAINKGNSGGPLFNMDGEVVGVNTAIISPTGGSIGIGFAVPADTVTAVISQLKEFGQVKRGWLGVKIQSISEDIGESLGVPENTGALVAGVTPDSPAAKAGVEAGDVILKFDGKDVTTMRGLPKLVAQAPIGKTVDVEVLRQGQKKTLSVSVGTLNDEEDNPQPASTDKKEEKPEQPSTSVLGLTLSPLTDDVRSRLGFDAKVKGVIVTDIDPSSQAATKNIRAGDVITEAQQEPVTTPADLEAAIEKVKKSGGKSVLLLVEDVKGDTRFVAIPF
ncbi:MULTISPECIES: Do family serine endopeptidase [Hyphomicrobium]|uniref:Do family serine endopeptidase n=1 Tax=Hyphomicrobium TaxID=81 RepID=UPI00037A9370|nr:MULTISPECIES: Do family serine endopeptidase [Hyphomicrobium]WBT37498.1 Do family serine endopeptidase [Hyphomicrobium sp. DMF-1]